VRHVSGNPLSLENRDHKVRFRVTDGFTNPGQNLQIKPDAVPPVKWWSARCAALAGCGLGRDGAGLIRAFSGYDFTQLSSMDAKSAFKMLAFAALAGVITEACRRRTL